MRTAQEYSPTKEKLLDSAQALMLEKGFSATSVDEICAAAGLTKGSFFHYFEGKDHLGKVLLERFCAEGSRKHRALCGEETDPLKRVYGYIDGAVKLSQDPQMKGCLLGTFAQELCESYPEIQVVCKRGFDSWTDDLAEEFARAKAKYAPRADFQPRELAEHFIAILEGSLILGKARKDMKVMEKNLALFKDYLKHLFKRSNKNMSTPSPLSSPRRGEGRVRGVKGGV